MSCQAKLYIIQRVRVDGGGCWTWTRKDNGMGYGRAVVGARHCRAHVLAYEAFVGPVPDGLELDHLCRNRTCVNPRHLEPVTHRENVLRGECFAAVNARKTHCPQGHPYAGDNLYIEGHSRRCRKCSRARGKDRVRPRSFGGNAHKTHCPAGHEYSAENTYTDSANKRHCRACKRARDRRRNRAKV